MNDPRIDTIEAWLGTGSINLFGPQFCGKDTQGKILAELFDAVLFGGGDILRKHQERPDVQQAINAGNLAPTEAYRELVIPYFNRTEFDGKPLILSTVGRMHGEEDAVMEAAQSSNHPMKAALVLNIDETEVWRRYEIANTVTHDRGPRNDDSKEALERRLHEWRHNTSKVIDYYRQRNLVVEVDGKPPKEVVTENIIQALYDRALSEQ